MRVKPVPRRVAGFLSLIRLDPRNEECFARLRVRKVYLHERQAYPEQRVAQGAQANQGKMANFMSQLLPYTENLQRSIKAMPKVTPQDSLARMIANFEGMQKFSYKK